MRRENLQPYFDRVELLATEIDEYVPQGVTKTIEFRADLAGLFVVAVAAMYESCVKESIVTYAAQHSARFESFAQRSFAKLNSRIRLSDLKRYARNLGDDLGDSFDDALRYRKNKFLRISGINIIEKYDQVLGWRHDFAHAGRRNTTLEEAIKTHRAARHVVFAFHDAVTS